MSETVGLPGRGRQRYQTGGASCEHCKKPAHEHDKERVYPDDGPVGSYHYRLYCKDGDSE